MKKIFKRNVLACFSPPVMIATFFIEIGLVGFLLLRRKINRSIQLAVLLLIALATFQLAEYGICEAIGLDGKVWARVGFAAITFLPPLGLHLVYEIAHQKSRFLILGAYGAAFVWIGIFVFSGIMEGQVCYGNYVIFRITDPAENMYYTYYNALLALAMLKGWLFIKKSTQRKTKAALVFLLLGYLAFIVPSLVVRLIFDFNDSSNSALPSIMCGFAVLLALILSLWVAPRASEPK